MSARRIWRNWSGSVQCEPNHRASPVTLEDVQAEVLRAAEGGERLRVVGGGRSFAPLCWTDENHLSLEHFYGIESADLEQRRVWVRAGTRMGRLLEQLSERGLALEAVGAVAGQTLGGAISTGAHGTGAALGSLSTQVRALRLVAANGSARLIDEHAEPGLLDAARLSLGALGVVTHVELQCVEPFKLEWHCRRASLEATLARHLALARAHRHFEFHWYPYTDRTQLRWSDFSQARVRPLSAARRARHWLSDDGLAWAGAQLVQRVPALAERVARYAAAGAAEGDCVRDGHRAARASRLRYHEIAYALPVERVAEAVQELDRTIRARKLPLHLPVSVRYQRADALWLSPAHGRDSASIAVRVPVALRSPDWFAALTGVLDRHGGRPHWAALHDKAGPALRALYPRFAEFARLRAELDPRGVFLNPHLASLFGAESR